MCDSRWYTFAKWIVFTVITDVYDYMIISSVEFSIGVLDVPSFILYMEH